MLLRPHTSRIIINPVYKPSLSARSTLSIPSTSRRWLTQTTRCRRDDVRICSGEFGRPEDPVTACKSVAKPSSTSLGIDAERLRTNIRNKSVRKSADRAFNGKTVTAYCAAERYDLHAAARLAEAAGYDHDPFKTGLYPQVIHIQTPRRASSYAEEVRETTQNGDLFIFPSGTVVAWNVAAKDVLHLVEQVLPPAAMNSHSGFVALETEDMEYVEDASRDESSVLGETIVLGTRPIEDDQRVRKQTDTSSRSVVEQAAEVDAVLAKIAFSSGLARSTKLAVLERLTDAYIESTRSIPTILSQGIRVSVSQSRILRRLSTLFGGGSRLPFTRSFILRKTGELLNIRAQLNLYSELTDSLPDLFWDAKHELGLEDYYDQVGKALDVGVRIHVLNQKMDYAQEIASTLRETLSERHSLRLEWGIIFLIAIEVIFGLTDRVEAYMEKRDPDSVEAMLKRHLQSMEGVAAK